MLAAALLLAAIVLAYLWPVLIGGKVLSPNSALYLLLPWRNDPPADLAHYLNLLLIDVPTSVYPWRVAVRDALHAGALPAWNAHVFAGSPLFSNPANGLFTPFSLPLWILPLNYGIGLGAALKLWAAAFGTYLLVRELRLGTLAGLLAGVAFAFSSIDIVWLTHESLPSVAALLPWMIWLVERIFNGARIGSVLGLGVATAFAIGGGHAGMQVHVVALAGLYALVRFALLRDEPLAARLRPLGLAVGGLALGALLMAVILVPEVLSSRGTIGVLARRGGRGTLPGSVMPFDAIKTVLFPDWWGRPSAFEAQASATSAGTVVNFNERTFYAGVVTVLLACVGLLGRERRRSKAPFLAFAVVGLAVPLHAPVLFWLATHLPVVGLVQSQRLHFAFAFGAAVLAAFGVQAVLDRPEERRRLAVPLVAVVAGAIVVATAGQAPGDFARTVRHFLTGADFARGGVVAQTSAMWFLLFALGVGALLLAALRWPRRVAVLAAGIVLLGALDMQRFAHGYQPMEPAAHVIPPVTPAVRYLQQHRSDGRVVGMQAALGIEWSIVYGLNDVRGYEPPQPSLRFYHLWRIAEPEQGDWQAFQIRRLAPRALQVMDVLGARYVVAEPGQPVPRGVRGVAKVYSGSDATIMRNERAVSRAFVAARTILTDREGGTLAAIRDPRFDARRTATIERGQVGAAALAASGPVQGTARITHEENASVTLQATLEHRGLVVLADNFAPGWSVAVDGHAAPALHVDDVLRGVVVGPGRHEIVWSYAVPGLRAGAALSLLGLAILLGACGTLVVRARRVRSETQRG